MIQDWKLPRWANATQREIALKSAYSYTKLQTRNRFAIAAEIEELARP